MDTTYHIGKSLFCTYLRVWTFLELISDFLVNKTRYVKDADHCIDGKLIFMVFSFNGTIFFSASHNTLEEWQIIFFYVWYSKILTSTNSYINSVYYFKNKPAKAKGNIDEGVLVIYTC